MFTFAHISDPHFTSLHKVSWRSLVNKRALGYLSWRLHRQTEHRPEILDRLIQDLAKHHPDHLVITGDLTHLGLPIEFREARQWLDTIQGLTETTVIPGNHEAYVATSYDSTLRYWEPYLSADPPSSNTSSHAGNASDQMFPSLRIRGPVAFIGLSSATPTPPFFATGFIDTAQLDKLAELLDSSVTQGLFRVLLVHHPPLSHSVRWRKRLTNAKQLATVLSHSPVDLILHGHTHRGSVQHLHTPTRSIPVIGVPSASAAGSKPGYGAQYCLFQAQKYSGNFHLAASVHTYSSATTQFHFDHNLSLSYEK